MLKKTGFVVGIAAAGMLALSGMASAHESGHHQDSEGGSQVGLGNLNNIDALHNVNGNLGLCGNDVNVLGVQVPLRGSLDGISVPLVSPGDSEATGGGSSKCATNTLVDGGSGQHS